MEPPEENKPRRNWMAIVVGSVFMLVGLVGICTGHISGGGRRSHVEYYVAQNPAGFWFTVALEFGVAAFLIVFGLKGKK